LSWLNFFLSGMQAAFGPIAAAYLGAQGWTARDIGFVLSIGGIAGLASQLPGGELLDTVRAKRLLVASARRDPRQAPAGPGADGLLDGSTWDIPSYDNADVSANERSHSCHARPMMKPHNRRPRDNDRLHEKSGNCSKQACFDAI
jgi:hypothetical protein